MNILVTFRRPLNADFPKVSGPFSFDLNLVTMTSFIIRNNSRARKNTRKIIGVVVARHCYTQELITHPFMF